MPLCVGARVVASSAETMDDRDYCWRLVNTPLNWQAASRDLICAANLLKKGYYSRVRFGAGKRQLSEQERLRHRHTAPRGMILLYAVAAENLLKATIVARGDDPVTHGGRLARWFTRHDLGRLAARARVRGLDEALLKQLSAFTTAGKYPVGLLDTDGEGAHSYFPDNVVDGIERLLPQLEGALGVIECRRSKLAPTDLLRMCAGRTPARGRRTPGAS